MGDDFPDWYEPADLGISHECSASTDLSLGDTDVTPPRAFQKPTSSLARIGDGAHKYADVEGREETREAIADHWLQNPRFDHQIPVPELEDGSPSVLVSPGGQAAMHHAINAALESGEQALLFEPYYSYHSKCIRLFETDDRLATIATEAATGFHPSLEAVEMKLRESTIGAIVLCSPANPTGVSYDDEWLRGLAELATTYDVNVVSDEVYAFLTYEDAIHRSIATYPGMSERTFVVGSFSKLFGISGWRLGFIRCPTKYFEPLVDVTDTIAMQAATAAQVLLEQALTADDELGRVDQIVDRLAKRMEVLVEPFKQSEKITVPEPDGGFYLLPTVAADYRRPIEDLAGFERATTELPASCEVAAGDCLHYHLLDVADVEGTPGRSFGPAAKPAVRLAYGQTPVEELRDAAARISSALDEF